MAYHGLRAKDKSFNASMKTDFDKNIGKINVIPQDLGCVILNFLPMHFMQSPKKRNSHPKSLNQRFLLSEKRLI